MSESEETPEGSEIRIKPPSDDELRDDSFDPDGPAEKYFRKYGMYPADFERYVRFSSTSAVQKQQESTEFDPNKYIADVQSEFARFAATDTTLGGDFQLPTPSSEKIAEEAVQVKQAQIDAARETQRLASLGQMELKGTGSLIPESEVPTTGLGSLPSEQDAAIAAKEAGLTTGPDLDIIDDEFGFYWEGKYKPAEIPEGYRARRMNVYTYTVYKVPSFGEIEIDGRKTRDSEDLYELHTHPVGPAVVVKSDRIQAPLEMVWGKIMEKEVRDEFARWNSRADTLYGFSVKDGNFVSNFDQVAEGNVTDTDAANSLLYQPDYYKHRKFAGLPESYQIVIKPDYWRKNETKAEWVVEPSPKTWAEILRPDASDDLKWAVAFYRIERELIDGGMDPEKAIIEAQKRLEEEMLQKSFSDEMEEMEEKLLAAGHGSVNKDGETVLTADELRLISDALFTGESAADVGIEALKHAPTLDSQEDLDALTAKLENAASETFTDHHNKARMYYIGTGDVEGHLVEQQRFEQTSFSDQAKVTQRLLREAAEEDYKKRRAEFQRRLDYGHAHGEMWAYNYKRKERAAALWHMTGIAPLFGGENKQSQALQYGSLNPYDEIELAEGMVADIIGDKVVVSRHWSRDSEAMEQWLEKQLQEEMQQQTHLLRAEDKEWLTKASHLRANARRGIIDLDNASAEMVKAAQGGASQTPEGQIESLMAHKIVDTHELDAFVASRSRAMMVDPNWGDEAKTHGWLHINGLPAHRAAYFWLSQEGTEKEVSIATDPFAKAGSPKKIAEISGREFQYIPYTEEKVRYDRRLNRHVMRDRDGTARLITFSGPEDPAWKEAFEAEARHVYAYREQLLKSARSPNPQEMLGFTQAIRQLKISSRDVKEGEGGENQLLSTVYDAENIGHSNRARLPGWDGVAIGGTALHAAKEDMFASSFRRLTGVDPWPRRHETFVDRTATTPFRVDRDVLAALQTSNPEHPTAKTLKSVSSWVEAWHEAEQEYSNKFPMESAPFRWNRSIAHSPYIVWPVTTEVWNPELGEYERLYVDPENGGLSVFPIPVAYIGPDGTDYMLTAEERQFAAMGAHTRSKEAERRFREGVRDPAAMQRMDAWYSIKNETLRIEEKIATGEIGHSGVQAAIRAQGEIDIRSAMQAPSIAPWWVINYAGVEGLPEYYDPSDPGSYAPMYEFTPALMYKELPHAPNSFGAKQLDAYKDRQMYVATEEGVKLVSMADHLGVAAEDSIGVAHAAAMLEPYLGLTKVVNQESLYSTPESREEKLLSKVKADATRKVQESMYPPPGEVLIQWLPNGAIKLDGDDGLQNRLRNWYYDAQAAKYLGTRDLGPHSHTIPDDKIAEFKEEAERLAWIDVTRVLSRNRGIAFFIEDPDSVVENVMSYTPALRPLMAAWQSHNQAYVHYPSNRSAWLQAGLDPTEMDLSQAVHMGVKQVPVLTTKIVDVGDANKVLKKPIEPNQQIDSVEFAQIVKQVEAAGLAIPTGLETTKLDENGEEVWTFITVDPELFHGEILPVVDFQKESSFQWLNKLFPMTIVGNQSRTLEYGIQTDWYAEEVEKLKTELTPLGVAVDMLPFGSTVFGNDVRAHAEAQYKIITGSTGNGAIDTMLIQNVNEGAWFSENMNHLFQEAVNAGTDLEGADLYSAKRTAGRIGEAGGWIVDIAGPDPFTGGIAIGAKVTKGGWRLYHTAFRYKMGRNIKHLEAAQQIIDNPKAFGLAEDAPLAERHAHAEKMLGSKNAALPFIVRDRIGARMVQTEGDLVRGIRHREAELAKTTARKEASTKGIYDDAPSFRLAAEDEAALLGRDLVDQTSTLAARHGRRVAALEELVSKQAGKKKPKPITPEKLRAALKHKGSDEIFSDPRIHEKAAAKHPDDVGAYLDYGYELEKAQTAGVQAANLIEHSVLTLGESATRQLLGMNPALGRAAAYAPFPILSEAGKDLVLQGLGNARIRILIESGQIQPVPYVTRTLDNPKTLRLLGQKELGTWRSADELLESTQQAVRDYEILLADPKARFNAWAPERKPLPIPSETGMMPRRAGEAKKAAEDARQGQPLVIRRDPDTGRYGAPYEATPNHGSWEIDAALNEFRATEIEAQHAQKTLENFQGVAKNNAPFAKHYDDTVAAAEKELDELEEVFNGIDNKYKNEVREAQRANGVHDRASAQQAKAEGVLKELQEQSVANTRRAVETGSLPTAEMPTGLLNLDEFKEFAQGLLITPKQADTLRRRLKAAKKDLEKARAKTQAAEAELKKAQEALKPYFDECAQPGKRADIATQKIMTASHKLNQDIGHDIVRELPLTERNLHRGTIKYPASVGKWYKDTEKALKRTARDARKTNEAVSRKLGTLWKGSQENLKRHFEMVSNAVSDMLSAARQQRELELVGNVYRDVADELRRGYAALKAVPEGVANGMRPRASWWSKFRHTLQGPERQGSAYDWLATFTSKEDKKTLGRTVDAPSLFSQIDSIYGKAVRRAATARPTGANKGATVGGIASDTYKNLRKAWKQQGKPKQLRLQAREVEALTGLPEELRRVFFDIHPEAAGLRVADMLENVRKDPALLRLVAGKSGVIAQGINKMQEFLRNFQDPASAIIGGKFNEDMVEIVKTIQHLVDDMGNDLYWLGRKARKEAGVIPKGAKKPTGEKLTASERKERAIADRTRELLESYVTWDGLTEAPIMLKTGMSAAIPTSMRDPLWDMFLHNSLTDPSNLPLKVKLERAEAAEIKRRRKLVAKRNAGTITEKQTEELRLILREEEISKQIAGRKKALRNMTAKQAEEGGKKVEREVAKLEKMKGKEPTWKEKWLDENYGPTWNSPMAEGNTFISWATHWWPSSSRAALTPDIAASITADAYKILEDTAKLMQKGELPTSKLAYEYAENRLRNATRVSSRKTLEDGTTAAAHADVDRDVTRATASGVMAITAGALKQHMWELTAKRILGTVTTKEAAAANKIWDGAYATLSEADLIAGYGVLNKMGMPVTTSYYRTAENAKRYHYMHKVATDSDGRALFMPQSVLKAVEDSLNVQGKEIGRLYQKSAEKGAEQQLGAMSTFNTLWKQSVITGTVIPRPQYVNTNLWGDWSQMVFGHGYEIGTRVTFNTLSGIPWWSERLGKSMDEVTDAVFRSRKGKGRQAPMHIMASPSSAVFNTWANKIWRGDNGVMRTAHGEVINFRQLRRELHESVLDTQVNEELLNYLTDVTKNAPWHAVGRWSDDIRWFAQHLQTRMRGNLYMELRVRRGFTQKEAVRAVRESLYDWKHGITKAEVATLCKVMPFWRFWRLAFKQMGRRVAEPLTKPNKAIMDSFTGRTALNRIRSQLNFRDRIYDGIIDPHVEGEIQSEQQWLDEMERHLRPDWMLGRALIGHQASPDPDFWVHSRGKPYQYEAMMLPPLTITDIGEIGASWMLGTGAALAHRYDGVQPDRPMSPGGTMGRTPWGTVTPGDWESFIFEPALNMLFPRYKEFLESFLLDAGVDTGGYEKGEYINVNEAEHNIMQKWDSAFGTQLTQRGKSPQFMIDAGAGEYEGRFQMHRGTWLFMQTMVPWVSVEVSGFLNNIYYQNPYAPRYNDLAEAYQKAEGDLGVAWNQIGPPRTPGDASQKSLMSAGWRALQNYSGFKWYPYEASKAFEMGDVWDLDDRGQVIQYRGRKAVTELGELSGEAARGSLAEENLDAYLPSPGTIVERTPEQEIEASKDLPIPRIYDDDEL
tara:strand:+ start:13817 stop:24913 length:11097 start_codon:yes stop_codon:yes gene_type:complete